MQRKEFIKTCGFACLAMASASVLLSGCAGANYFAKTEMNGNRIVVKKSEFIKIENDKTSIRKYILVRSEKLSFPICVYQADAENYTALLMECTHKGCELQPHGDFLVCPCHGSEFSNKGVVQNPPAEQNLKTFNITADNENIYIQL